MSVNILASFVAGVVFGSLTMKVLQDDKKEPIVESWENKLKRQHYITVGELER